MSEGGIALFSLTDPQEQAWELALDPDFRWYVALGPRQFPTPSELAAMTGCIASYMIDRLRIYGVRP